MSLVSITLQNTDDARAIIDAIMSDNPGAELSRFPAMVKINAEGEMSVNRETVENKLGRAWDVQEIHLSLISLSGNIDEDDDRFRLFWHS